MAKIMLGLFFGGRSVEHEVSVISALQAYKHLDKEKYEVLPIYVDKSGHFYTNPKFLDIKNFKDINALLLSSTQIVLANKQSFSKSAENKGGFLQQGLFKKFTPIDVALPIFHGSFGEDGAIQGMFEIYQIPYVGLNVTNAAVSIDKSLSKDLFKSLGLPIGKYKEIKRLDWWRNQDACIAEIIGGVMSSRTKQGGVERSRGKKHNLEISRQARNDKHNPTSNDTEDSITSSSRLVPRSFGEVGRRGSNKQSHSIDADPRLREDDVHKGGSGSGFLKYPLFVKPATGGSSIGANKAKDLDELQFAIEVASIYSEKIIVEEAFENCIEVNCAALGYEEIRASVCEMPIPSKDLLSFQDKYQRGGKGSKGAGGMESLTREIPAPIPKKLTKEIQEATVKIFKAMDGCGVARIDFFVDPKKETFWVNEVNSPPGSLAFYLWEKSDPALTYTELLDELIEMALKRAENQKKTQYTFESGLLAQMAKAS